MIGRQIGLVQEAQQQGCIWGENFAWRNGCLVIFQYSDVGCAQAHQLFKPVLIECLLLGRGAEALAILGPEQVGERFLAKAVGLVETQFLDEFLQLEQKAVAGDTLGKVIEQPFQPVSLFPQ